MPALVGVPLSNPELLRLSPADNFPVMLHVIGDGPSACNWAEYDLSVGASVSDDVVIIGGVLAVKGLST